MLDWLLRYKDSDTGPGQGKYNDNNSNTLKQHLGMLTQNTPLQATTLYKQGDPPISAPASSHFRHLTTYHPSLAPHNHLPCSLFPHSKLHKDLAQGLICLQHTKSTSSRMKTVIPKSATTALSAWSQVTTLTATAANGALKHTLPATAPDLMKFATPRTAMSQSLTQTMANTALNTLTTPLSFYSPPWRNMSTLLISQVRTTHVENESLGRVSCYDHRLVNCYLCIPLLPF
jgi:hypothetical protein